MQHIDGVAHVQALADPTRHGRPRVQVQPVLLMARPQKPHRIAGDCGGVRDLREKLSVRTSKPELAAGQSLHLVALFVNCTVMPTTQQREIGQRGRTALRPVVNVMSLADADTAAREATTGVSVVQGAP
jgi:hypothetical protein